MIPEDQKNMTTQWNTKFLKKAMISLIHSEISM